MAQPVMPGVPSMGHTHNGYWHPGRAEGCVKCPPTVLHEIAWPSGRGPLWLRVGDLVKVKPSKPGKRDGYIGRVRRIRQHGRRPAEIEVAGGPPGKAKHIRTFTLDRLERTTAKEATQ